MTSTVERSAGRGRRLSGPALLLAAVCLLGACRSQPQPPVDLGATPERATILTVPADAVNDSGPTAAGPTDAGAALPISPSATEMPAPTATVRPASFDPAAVELTLTQVAEGLDEPIGIQAAGDGSGRLFILEKAGRVRVLAGGELLAAPFLDLRDRVGSGTSERGLLGLAFHPHAGRDVGDRRLYVNYTDKSGDTVLAEYRGTADPDRADPDSERVLLRVAQPAANHNGGDLAFGPDGYLYAALGDGGPNDHGAGRSADGRSGDPATLLGAVLRLDVDGGEPYGIPPDNPFLADETLRDEIWAYGLRNPWRISFDRATGELYIADVGAGDWEEVNHQPAGAAGGADYGWPVLEGEHCRGGDDCVPPAGAVPPVLEYSHAEGGCAITGGYVYRGASSPLLAGVYLFGDYCSGRIWAGWRDASAAWQRAELQHTDLAISSFGQDEAGELYVADRAGGKVFRLGAEARP